jgi:hypothetical protein
VKGTKKVAILFLALTVALGAMGAGFAHWSQTLYINGTVETGTFLVGFEDQYTDDPPAVDGTPGVIIPQNSPDDGTIDPGYDKNVAACDCELLFYKGDHDGVDLFEKVHVTVLNGYPCYTNILTVTIGNGGTIPANVGDASVTVINGVPLAQAIPLPKCETVPVDLNGDGLPDINLHWDGPEDQQIDPCQTKDFTLTIHVKQDISDGSAPTTNTFEIEIETVQWNFEMLP